MSQSHGTRGVYYSRKTTGKRVLRFPSLLYEEMIAHCQRGYPLEACGIFSGKQERVEKVYPMRNADKSAVSYCMESSELLQVTKALRQEGKEMIGIFHSHVASEAYPSKTDVNLAFYPSAVYVIISLKDPKLPVALGYRIVDGEIAPDELKLE